LAQADLLCTRPQGGGGPLLQAAFPEGGTQLLLVLQRWQAKLTVIKSACGGDAFDGGLSDRA
jgi:hypothetical protein